MGYFAENFEYVEDKIYPINEAYFGRTKGCKEIQKCIHDIRKKYMPKAVKDKFENIHVYSPAIDKDADKKALVDAIKKEFGFRDLTMTFIASSMQNSFVIDSAVIGMNSNNLAQSVKSASSKSTGFKFNSSDDVVGLIFMSTGLILDPKITDEEITAILLHEIGHQFAPAVEKGAKILYRFPALVSILNAISSTVNLVTDNKDAVSAIKFKMSLSSIGNIVGDKFKGIIDKIALFVVYIMQLFQTVLLQTNMSKKIYGALKDLIDDIMKKHPDISIAIASMMTFLNIGSDAYQSGMQIINFFGDGALSIKNYAKTLKKTAVKQIVGGVTKPTGYAEEKFADAFPRMYGYGPDLVTGLQKIRMQPVNLADYATSKVPLVQFVRSIYMAPYDLLIATIDEHPTDIDRFNFIASDIKNELENSDLSEKTKKQIMKDAEDIQKGIETYKNNISKMGKNSVLGLYENVVNKLFGGTIRSKLIGRNVNDDIDKFIDSLDK